MVYRVIDDDTALEIYDAIQKRSDRDFSSYQRVQQLPKLKITGEVVFYLDELIDFAERELGQDPAEALAAVIDAGVVSWFGGLDDAHRQKLGLRLASVAPVDSVVPAAAAPDGALADEIAALKAEQQELRREITRLQIENEELLERVPDDPTVVSMQPAYLNNESQSAYTEMTSHVLGNGNRAEARNLRPKKAKQSRRRR